MHFRQALQTGQILPDEVLVVHGEVHGGHAVHAEADLLLEQVVGLPDQSLQEHLQEGVEDVLTELYLRGGRERERKREGGREGRGRGEGGGGRGGRRGEGREGKGGGVREVRREG